MGYYVKEVYFIENRVDELAVITQTKALCNIVILCTAKSPKKFRFTLVSKLQTYSLNALENLFRANEVYIKGNLKNGLSLRMDFQHKALTELNLLAFITQLAYEQQCILKKDYLRITHQIFGCKNLLGGWIRSEHKKISSLKY